MSARRYLVLIQDAKGYPARGAPLPTKQPMLHNAVLADDYEALEAENERLRAVLGYIADKAKYLAEGAWNESGTRIVGEQIAKRATAAMRTSERTP
jgi:hypothetical protein